jgi:hypothetical protein
MNSIDDLNQQTFDIQYEDPRPATVIFNRGTALNGTQSALEGQEISAFWGIDIVSIINYDIALPTYTVNVSNNSLATVSWTNLPAHCTVTLVSTGVYRVSGIRSEGDWLDIRSPKILLPFDYFGTFTYTSTIASAVTSSKPWTTTLTVTDVKEWTEETPNTYWYPVGTAAVQNVPQLIDSANPVESWYCLIIPSETTAVSSFTTNGVGGTTSFNNETKVLTIEGTNTEINSHLQSLSMTTAGAGEQFFNVIYRVVNLLTGQNDNSVQALKPATIRYLSTPQGQQYSEDTQVSLTSASLITHTEAVGTETYSVLVTPSSTSAVATLSSNGSGGTSTFNNTNKVLTLTGTKTQVNSHLNSITLQPGSDFTSNFSLGYFVTITPTGYNQTKTQSFTNVGVHDEITNISFDRNFVNGANNLLFPTNIPSITDLDPNPGNYTVTLTVVSGVGTFSAEGTTTSRTWSYTGTKSQVNSIFSQITFNPATNYFLNTTVAYTQSKTVGQQVNTTFNLNGPDVAFDRVTPTNQTIASVEGASHSIPIGLNIIGVNDYATTLPVYTIDVSDCPGATVSWPTIPSGCIVSNPSAGVYSINGITDASVWTTIRSPNVTLSNSFVGSFTYTATVYWNNGSESNGWSVLTTVATDVDLLTAVTGFNFYSGRTYNVTGYPQINDQGSQDPNYTVTITPSVVGAVNTMSCTNGTFNNSTKVLTISGTKAQVNTGLSSISLTVAGNQTGNFNLVYYATNSLATENSTKTQTLTKLADATVDTLTPSPQTVNAFEGGEFTHLVSANLTFINEFASPLPNYVFDMSGAPGSVVEWATIPVGCTVTNPSADVYKLSGISNLSIWNTVKAPKIKLSNGFSGSFNYTSTIYWNNDTEASSWTVTTNVSDVDLITGVTGFDFYSGRSYLVTGYPQLQDTGSQTLTYTVTLTPSTTGAWTNVTSAGTGGTTSFSSLTKVYTIQGTLTQVNSHLAAITVSINGTLETNFNIVYQATNSVGTETQSRTQTLTKLTDVTFDTLTPATQSVSLIEGDTHSVPVAANITFINENDSPLPRYTINVSNIPGATVTWPTVPSGCTVTNPSTGIYTISNISTVAQWNTVRSPTVLLDNVYNGSTTYTATIGYNQSSTLAWTVNISVSNVDALTDPVNFQYYSSSTQDLTGLSNIVDAGSQTPTWTITLTPEKTSTIFLITSNGSGGTFTYNNVSKVCTIVGTKTQVNSHLNNLRITSVDGQDLTYNYTIAANNTANSETANKTQIHSSNNFTVTNAVRGNLSYTLNQSLTLTNGPLINSSETGTYTLDVSAVPSNAVSSVLYFKQDYTLDSFPEALSDAAVEFTDTYIVVLGNTASNDTGRIYIYDASTYALLTSITLAAAAWLEDIRGNLIAYQEKVSRQIKFYNIPNATTITIDPPAGHVGWGAWSGFTNNRFFVADPSRTVSGVGAGAGAVYIYDLNGTLLYTRNCPRIGQYTEDHQQFGSGLITDGSNAYFVMNYWNNEFEPVGRLYGLSAGNNLFLIAEGNTPGNDYQIYSGELGHVKCNRTAATAGDQRVNVNFKIWRNSGGNFVLDRTIDSSQITSDGYTIETQGTISKEYFIKIAYIRPQVGGPRTYRAYVYSMLNGNFIVKINLAMTLRFATIRETKLCFYPYDTSPFYFYDITTTLPITITGTKEYVNSQIDNAIFITPALNYNQTFEIYYDVTTPSGFTSVRNQKIIY